MHADGYENAGLDMDQPGNDGHFSPSKLMGDKVTLDDMATRVLTALMMVDAFDHPVRRTGPEWAPPHHPPSPRPHVLCRRPFSSRRG
eukprot:SAG31_NODE_2294_length_5991_cov_2.589613_1_plen_87_part_00